MTFKEKVLAAVSLIPEGQTRSYKEIATQAGNSKAARAVGTILKGNRDLAIPCHRVIRSDGQCSDYNGLLGLSKAVLLQQEREKHGTS